MRTLDLCLLFVAESRAEARDVSGRAPGKLVARPTAPGQLYVLSGRGLGAATALASRACRPPLHTRGRRGTVRALRHPLGHLGVDKADLGPLRYLQQPVHVHKPVAGHGQLFRLFTQRLGHFVYPGAAGAGHAGHSSQVVALLGPQPAPGDFVLARQLGSS